MTIPDLEAALKREENGEYPIIGDTALLAAEVRNLREENERLTESAANHEMDKHKAERERDQAAKERDEAKDKCRQYQIVLDPNENFGTELVARAEAAEAALKVERERVERLKKYVMHKYECDVHAGKLAGYQKPCGCGLDEVLLGGEGGGR